jgi:hypothetical protein
MRQQQFHLIKVIQIKAVSQHQLDQLWQDYQPHSSWAWWAAIAAQQQPQHFQGS